MIQLADVGCNVLVVITYLCQERIPGTHAVYQNLASAILEEIQFRATPSEDVTRAGGAAAICGAL